MDFPPPAGARLGYDLESSFDYAAPEEVDDFAVVQGRYELSLWIPETDPDGGDERQQFAAISFTLIALFDLPTQEPSEAPYSEDEWQAFVETSARFALHPYMRETAAMLTTRLGVPPLTIGVLRLELNREEVESLTPGE